MCSRLAATVLAAALAVPGGALAVPDEGQIEYLRNCAVCHAIDGYGDGPYAVYLKTRPADLTRLSARNGGAFPFEDIYRIIDGRTEFLAHGPREMPVWGTEYRRDAMQTPPTERETSSVENEVTTRILRLIDYLESIQRP